jgi:hypothetical protein
MNKTEYMAVGAFPRKLEHVTMDKRFGSIHDLHGRVLSKLCVYVSHSA